MAFVIAEPCIGVKDRACVEACPVDCIYDDEDQLFIHPSECIDCGACEPVCPVQAIFPVDKVPSEWESFIQKNIDFFKTHPDAKVAARKGEVEGAEEQKAEVSEVKEAAVAKVETVAVPPVTPKPSLVPVSTAEESKETVVEAAVEEREEKPKVQPTPKPAPVVLKPVERPRPTVVRERVVETQPAAKIAQPQFRLKNPVRSIVKASQPLTGALSAKFKRELEEIAQDPKVFSAAFATGINCLLNTVLYVMILTIMGIKSYGLYSNLTNLYIFIGLVLGALETTLRFKKGMIMTAGEDNHFPATWYGKPLSYIFEPLLPVIRNRFLEPIVIKEVKEEKPQQISIPAAPIHSDDLRERDRRYGLVHGMVAKADSYLIAIEFPRRVPYSKHKEELKLPDEMPDYKRQITLQGNMMYVEARLEDPKILEIAGRASSFPSSFLCEFKFDKDVFGFEDRYHTQDKILEITVHKKKG